MPVCFLQWRQNLDLYSGSLTWGPSFHPYHRCIIQGKIQEVNKVFPLVCRWMIIHLSFVYFDTLSISRANLYHSILEFYRFLLNRYFMLFFKSCFNFAIILQTDTPSANRIKMELYAGEVSLLLNLLQVNYENKKHAHGYIQIFHPQSEALLIYPKWSNRGRLYFFFFIFHYIPVYRLAVKKIKIMIRILIRMTDMLYGVKSKSFENVISLVLNTSRKNFIVKYYSNFSLNNQIDFREKIK